MSHCKGNPLDPEPINWDNLSVDEFLDILEDINGHEIKRSELDEL